MTNKNFWDVSPITAPDMQSQELYDYKTPGAPQRFWRRHEFAPVSDYLMTFRNKLIRDFLKGHRSLEEAVKAKQLPGVFENRHELAGSDIGEIVRSNAEKDLRAWRSLAFKYQHKNVGYDILPSDPLFVEKYPTACGLVQEFGNDVAIAAYSVIDPNSVIHRHTGPENRDGEFLRIHIPLIVPEGDIFFECLGEIIDWSDIWGFNNQLIHSAHNYTNEYRLVFLIDLRRTAIGLEPGVPFDPEWQIHAKPFIRDKQ